LSVAVGVHKRRRFLAVVLLIVTAVGSISILTTYYLLSSSNEATQSAQVGSIFAAHLHNIESKNASAVTREYADNATLNMAETTPDHITGTHEYSGSGKISAFWVDTYQVERTFAPFITVGNASYTVKVSGRTALVNATFYLTETPECMFRSLVKATVSYVNSSGKWLISNEAWDARDVNGTLCGGVHSNPP